MQSNFIMNIICKLLFLLCFSGVVEASHKRVLLEDVQALTFKGGEYTLGRRAPAIPKLNCMGGNGCDLAQSRGALPNVIQCINRGSDGTDAQWECSAELDSAFQLGVTDVACEGYEYPNDPYVLEGSCGLEFTIELTPKGKILSEQTLSFQGLLPGIVFWIGVLLLCVVISSVSTPGYGHRGYASRGYASRGYASRRSRGYGRSRRSTGFGGTKRR